MPLVLARYETLSAMITPALFMTANGSLLISTSNRMSRVVDRIRVLNEAVDQFSRGSVGLDFLADRHAHAVQQIERLQARSNRIRWALTMLYMAFSSFVGASLTLAFDVLVANRIELVPTTLAVAGTSLMLGACVNLVREARVALRGNDIDIAFYRTLHERRQAQGEAQSNRPAG